MQTQIITLNAAPAAFLIPPDADKDTRSRLGAFAAWLEAHARPWHEPDLRAYRDAMVAQDYAPATIRAHLSTIRARYRRLLRDNDLRDALEHAIRAGLAAQGQSYGPADVEALVRRKLDRLANAIDPAASPVTTKTSQDRPDTAHLRLTQEQANALLAAPGLDDLRGLRDTAVIALLLCTGLRESELSALEVKDLRQHLGGELALHVREGKGCKERLVPYGELDWVLVIVDAWLDAASIDEGPVFRGFYRGNRTLRPGTLSVRAIQYLLARYPIAVRGELVQVKPHDLRRTYARRLYEAGMAPVELQQNLGHAGLKTTLGYIGTLGADQRRPPAIYAFDLSQLPR
ncbi:MAG: tyrosine-type recombinase/integrase [Chloroflexota bacterium]|nr:tyrosine-type recombinase/integrase [Chloroflexota bacterium]